MCDYRPNERYRLLYEMTMSRNGQASLHEGVKIELRLEGLIKFNGINI